MAHNLLLAITSRTIGLPNSWRDDMPAYDIGKPLIIEEMFPLKCSIEDLAKL